MRSLSGKLVLLAVTSTGITAGALSAVQLRQTSDRETEIAFIRLEDLAKRNARTIGLQLERVQQEARFISGFPPIAGIQRARMNGDAYDLHGFSTEAELRERLSGIFKSVIRERPSYAQIRLIGKDGNWREIVRVDRRGDDIFTVPEDQLQSKAGETYLEGIEGMKPGDDYFADITLNRENRLDVGPAMLRMVRPVFGPQGDLFGAVVINVDAERLMRDAVSDISSQVTIVTSEGHYMRFGPGYPEPDLELSGAWDWVTPPNWDFRNDHGRHIRDGTAYFVAGLHLGGLSRALAWHVITERPISALLGKSREHVRSGIAVSGLIMALAMLASWAWGRRITGPLRKLHATIIAYDGESNLADRPKFGRDEIGALAEAFWRLSDDLMGETRRTESLFRVAASGIIVINRNGRIEKINAAAEALFGYGPEELFGQNLSCLMDRDTAAQHPGFIKGFHHGTKPMSRAREIFGVRKDGSRVPLDITVSSVQTPTGGQIIGIVNDISARKEVEAKLTRMISTLERSNTELDQFAYVASHDLRAPLRVIENASRWLAEDLEEHLTEDTRETLGLLQNRVARMDRLLDDLLKHARIGRVADACDLIHVAELLEDVAGLAAAPEGIRLVLDPGDATILVNRMPLQTVLLNLVANSIKHHDRTEGEVRVTVSRVPGKLVLTVADDGPGIPPEHHERIFELFQTLRPRDELEGSGMGLAIVQKHVVTVGGEIEVVSDGFRGTLFRVSWPDATKGGDPEVKAA